MTDSDLDAMEAEAKRESDGAPFGYYVPHSIGHVLQLVAEVRRLQRLVLAPVSDVPPRITCEVLKTNPPCVIFRDRLPGATTQ